MLSTIDVDSCNHINDETMVFVTLPLKIMANIFILPY